MTDQESADQPDGTIEAAEVDQSIAQDKQPATSDAAEPVVAPAAPRRADLLARSLVVLLWLALGGVVALGWYVVWPELLARDARLTALEQQAEDVAGSASLEEVAASIEPLQRQLAAFDQQLVAETRAQQVASSRAEQRVDDSLRRFDERLLRTDERISRLTGTDRRSWLVQESAFMVRLAGQRLAAARDVDSAIALLRTADDLLLEADDPLLDAARRSLAADVASLRALPPVDRVGIDARLEALIRQADALSVAKRPDLETPPPADGWLGRAEVGWQAALDALAEHLVIRQRSDELASLLTPDWEVLARQNLRMLLEQAQIAALSGNPMLYERAIDRAKEFALQFSVADPDRVDTLVMELEALRMLPVSRVLPDLLESRRALAEANRQLGAEVVN